MSNALPTPPAGWYPDPSGQAGHRYFDGNTWTENQATPSVPPPPKRSKKTAILTSVAAIFAVWFMGSFISGFASGGHGKTPTAGSSASPSATAAVPSRSVSAPTPVKPAVAPTGSAVRDGKFEFRVLDTTFAKTVSDPTGNPYMTVTAQGTFLVVTLSVANIGDQPQNYFGQNQKVLDVSGREYGASSEADMYMNTGVSVMGDINPGNSIQVKAAFDVPPGTVPTALEVDDSMFSGGVKVGLA